MFFFICEKNFFKKYYYFLKKVSIYFTLKKLECLKQVKVIYKLAWDNRIRIR